MNLEGVKVGDILVRTGGGVSGEEVPVVKVGRKLLTVQESPGRYGEGVYRIENGVKNDNYGHSYLETREAYRARQERNEVLNRVRATGLNFGYVSRELSTAKLRALLAVMEDDSL